ncbi:MAG TPA: ribonuclease H-like domain-containing protein [Vicinamibacterales bacterium]|nr:ribonuclease H-like domain-containing protein [Vicinamibacterales bacterium]
MTTLADRLRGVIRPGGGGPPKGGPYDGGPYQEGLDEAAPDGRGGRLQAAQDDTAAEVLDGQWRESDGHRFLVVDRTYVPGYRHGSMVLADALPPSDGLWPRLSLLADTACGGNLLFVDLETTGLAGGAGTYAFLVGCAWFAGGTFRVRQFFLSSFAAERVLLEAVRELAETSGTVVTYNGKSFDLPLIETRFALHRMSTPFAGLPHIDMLHPARRMWRSSEEPARHGPANHLRQGYGGPPKRSAEAEAGHYDGSAEAGHNGRPMSAAIDSGSTKVSSSCRLSTLEQTLCGYVREGDVPGFEIPARYFRYVRSGDARPLEAVLEHNRLDLLSLALVTARAAQLLDEGAPGASTAREALGLGRLYERGGMMIDARACFARAADTESEDEGVRAEALRAFAVLSRRMRRFEEAAAAWRRLLDLDLCPQPLVREASEALAVHLEHRLRDPLSARGFALRSLQVDNSAARRQATAYRLARLDRKLGSQSQAVPLF